MKGGGRKWRKEGGGNGARQRYRLKAPRVGCSGMLLDMKYHVATRPDTDTCTTFLITMKIMRRRCRVKERKGGRGGAEKKEGKGGKMVPSKVQ